MVTSVPALVWAARRSRSPWMRAALGVLLLLAALWVVPPMLDWGRYRNAIAAIAAGQLGRPVAIGGDVTLRLLPEAVLTAADVTFPAQPGTPQISAKVGALRLQVAFWPLLAGKIVLRDLVLSAPQLTLPWPLPDSFIHPVRPRVPQAFAAHVEGGTLRIGAELFSGITAAIHGGPVAGPLAGPTIEAAAFGAEGFASFGTRRWRFTSALGAPDADGVSAIDFSVLMSGDQAGPGHDTGATVQGTLADGVLQGRVKAGGPDLSLLMPAAQLAWHAEAPFVASGARVESGSLTLLLGGAMAQGSATLNLAGPARLDGKIDAASVDLDSWLAHAPAGMAGSALRWLQAAGLPMRVALHADQIILGERAIDGFEGVAVFDDAQGGAAQAALEYARAQGPGGVSVSLGRTALRPAAGGFTLHGPVEIAAPNLRTTGAWLQRLAPALVAKLPPGVLNSAKISGQLVWSPGWLALLGAAGTVDHTAVTGGIGFGFGSAQPAIAADLSFLELNLDDWLGDAAAPASLADFGHLGSQMPLNLVLRAGTARWQGRTWHDVSLAARSSAAGLAISHLSGTFDGADFTASGMLATDGAVQAAHFGLRAQDAAHLFADLPAAWRWAPGLWHGPATLAAAASGPPAALTIQLRADAGDALLEAEATRDTLAGTQSATITLRHPGAPRLLAALGLPGAETWLDTGSLTLLAHAKSTPRHLVVEDVALNAADLRLAGDFSVDFTGHVPAIEARITGDMLALPAGCAAPKLPALLAWLNRTEAHVKLAVQAAECGLRPVASGISAEFSAAAGNLLADHIAAHAVGGTITGQLAIDSARARPMIAAQLTLQGAQASTPGLPVSFESGVIDADADLTTEGTDVASWRTALQGPVHATFTGVQLAGFDLTQLARAASARPQHRKSILAALSQGATPDFSGAASAQISKGVLAIAPSLLESPTGQVSLSGDIETAGGATNLALELTPKLPARPIYIIKLTGIWPNIQALPEQKPLAHIMKKAPVSHRTPHTPIAADAAPGDASPHGQHHSPE